MKDITQLRQMAKGKAFNSLLRIYHPKSNWKGFPYDRENSYSEQREMEVKWIFNEYFKEMQRIIDIRDKKYKG